MCIIHSVSNRNAKKITASSTTANGCKLGNWSDVSSRYAGTASSAISTIVQCRRRCHDCARALSSGSIPARPIQTSGLCVTAVSGEGGRRECNAVAVRTATPARVAAESGSDRAASFAVRECDAQRALGRNARRVGERVVLAIECEVGVIERIGANAFAPFAEQIAERGAVGRLLLRRVVIAACRRLVVMKQRAVDD